jgi:hypothetical protein
LQISFNVSNYIGYIQPTVDSVNIVEDAVIQSYVLHIGYILKMHTGNMAVILVPVVSVSCFLNIHFYYVIDFTAAFHSFLNGILKYHSTSL